MEQRKIVVGFISMFIALMMACTSEPSPGDQPETSTPGDAGAQENHGAPDSSVASDGATAQDGGETQDSGAALDGAEEACDSAADWSLADDDSLTLIAQKTAQPLTVDGIVEEIDGDLLQTQFTDTLGRSDNHVTARAVWTPAYLAFAVEVSDEQLEYDAAVGTAQNDGIEIFLDTDHQGSEIGPRDFQWILPVDGEALVRQANDAVDTVGFDYAITQTAQGFTVEMQVPWEEIGVTPTEHMRLGLLIANNDRDGGAHTPFSWAGYEGSFKQPLRWGDLRLGGQTCPPPSEEPPASPTMCGNGSLEEGEDCDDGNTADADGCSSGCAVETDWACFEDQPSVCGRIKYVARDSSGDFQADGRADDRTIQQAMEAVAADPQYVAVHLKEGAYELENTTRIPNDIILQGDRNAVLKLKSRVGLPRGKALFVAAANPAKNIVIRGFELDGNRSKQSESSGKGYHNGFVINHVTNLTVRDMHIHDSLGDGIKVTDGKDLHFYNNRIVNIGHDCFYLIDVDGVHIHDNPHLSTRTNTTLRLVASKNARIHHNHMNVAVSGIQIQKGGENIEAHHNRMENINQGFWLFSRDTDDHIPTRNIHIHHNLIYNAKNPGYWRVHGINVWGFGDVLIENNVIWDFTVHGISSMKTTSSSRPAADRDGTITIRNNIIGKIRKDGSGTGYAIRDYLPSHHNFVVKNNCFFDNDSGSVRGVAVDEANLEANPLFADPSAGDFHLKSTAGRFDAGQWISDATTSPCIDAGDPDSAFDQEPSPSGGRINAGAYGNTPEASKS